MANRKPTPLKDEPVVPLDELQELLAANLDAMEKLREFGITLEQSQLF